MLTWKCAKFSCFQSWFIYGVTWEVFLILIPVRFSLWPRYCCNRSGSNISHVSGQWFKNASNHTLTGLVICFLLSREAFKEKWIWLSICQDHTVFCAEHMTLSMLCYMQQKGKFASAAGSEEEQSLSENSKLPNPVTFSGPRRARSIKAETNVWKSLLLDIKPLSDGELARIFSH